jgi:serine/threonine protein kinase
MIEEHILKDLFAKHQRGRFEFKSILGKGGMGIVIRARDTRLKVPRAIKIFNPELLEHDEFVQRFENEASVMAGIEHPNIVRVYDISEVEGYHYIVLEWVSGGSLDDHTLVFGGMPARQAVEVVLLVCEALQVAHRKGIIHRDIKPANILLTEDGVVKVADFGIAHIDDEDSDSDLTGAKRTMGTAGYMALEQIVDAKSVDERSDLHGVAVMLWALMSAENPPDVSFINDVNEKPELLDCVPECLRPIIKKGCALFAKDRHDDLQEFVDDLEDVFDLLPEMPEDTPLLGTAHDEMNEDELRPHLLTPTEPGVTMAPSRTKAPKLDTSPLALVSKGSTEPAAGISLASIDTDASPDRISETEFYAPSASSSTNKKVEVPILQEEPVAQELPVVQEVVQSESLKRSVLSPKWIVAASVCLLVVGVASLGFVWSQKSDSVEEKLAVPTVAEPVKLALVQEVDAGAKTEDVQVKAEIDVYQGKPDVSVPADIHVKVLVKKAKPVVKKPVKKTPTVKKKKRVAKPKVRKKVVKASTVVTVFVGLKMSGGSSKVWLSGKGGKFNLPRKVPVGKYRVVANFGDNPSGTTVISSFEVKEGGTKKIVCNSAFENCKVR